MFISRRKELHTLQEVYERGGSGFVVVSGREGVGKTSLIRKFVEDKDSLYYYARECSDREQALSLAKDWELKVDISEPLAAFRNMLLQILSKQEGKKVIILDEFNRIVKNTDGFLQILSGLITQNNFGPVLFVLISSDIHWMEQEFIKALGGSKQGILKWMRLEPFHFVDVVRLFPNYDVEDAILIYSIMGGVPGYLKQWDPALDIKENIISLFLSKEGKFYAEAERFLKNNLRELALYNTVLATLADNTIRLNDVYERTGFSRAKISVYLKNLSQIGVIEKIEPYPIGKNDAALKGLYEISDSIIHFWYRYIFPNASALESGHAEWVFDYKVAPTLQEYARKYFVKVCREFMHLMNASGALPVEFVKSGVWYGKEGNLDMVAEDAEGHLLVCTCKWGDEPMAEDDLEELLGYLLKAGIEPDYFYLFSRLGFTTGLNEKSQYVNNMTLTSLDQF